VHEFVEVDARAVVEQEVFCRNQCADVIGVQMAEQQTATRGPRNRHAYADVRTDVLLQIFIVFFGLPSAGISLDAYWAGVIALGLNVGAYLSEVFRAGILSS
jgi:His/Glu/Gln/Arg/opine family amino acid ABC transporter permease subunit